MPAIHLRPKSACLGAAALCLAGAAAAQDLSSRNPDGIVAAMQAAGWQARLETTQSGKPVVRSSTGGLNFSVYFDSCNSKNRDCTVLYFNSGFDLANGVDPALLNDWNYNKLVGRAYMDEERDPFLDYVIIGEGGLRPENFRAILDRWAGALDDYARHVGYR
jgi:hypothetical protein